MFCMVNCEVLLWWHPAAIIKPNVIPVALRSEYSGTGSIKKPGPLQAPEKHYAIWGKVLCVSTSLGKYNLNLDIFSSPGYSGFPQPH